jgi:SulP family sulfate permease
MYSQHPVIRATYTGRELKSTVHRLLRQQSFLDHIGDEIQVLKLQGFMFFGTINQLDTYIEDIVRTSVRLKYIVIDFAMIGGVDYSATEAFHRLKKITKENQLVLVFCGLNKHVYDTVLFIYDLS